MNLFTKFSIVLTSLCIAGCSIDIKKTSQVKSYDGIVNVKADGVDLNIPTKRTLAIKNNEDFLNWENSPGIPSKKSELSLDFIASEEKTNIFRNEILIGDEVVINNFKENLEIMTNPHEEWNQKVFPYYQEFNEINQKFKDNINYNNINNFIKAKKLPPKDYFLFNSLIFTFQEKDINKTLPFEQATKVKTSYRGIVSEIDNVVKTKVYFNIDLNIVKNTNHQLLSFSNESYFAQFTKIVEDTPIGYCSSSLIKPEEALYTLKVTICHKAKSI